VSPGRTATTLGAARGNGSDLGPVCGVEDGVSRSVLAHHYVRVIRNPSSAPIASSRI